MPKPDLKSQADHIDSSLSSINNQLISYDERINNLSDSIMQIENKLIEGSETTAALSKKLASVGEQTQELSIKFDVWQANVESMLATTQSAMQYDNYVLTALAIIIAAVTFALQKWAAKSKEDAVQEAIQTIEDTIARGILPKRSGIRKKLVEAIINSDQFIEAVREASLYLEESEDADESRSEASSESSESVDGAALARAREQGED